MIFQDLYNGQATFTAAQIAENDRLPLMDISGDGGDPVSYHPITTVANFRELMLTGIPFLKLASSAYVVITADTVLTNDHNGKILVLNSGSNRTITYPSGLNLPFQCSFLQVAAGKIIFAAGGGITKVCADNTLFDRTIGDGAAATLTATSTFSAKFYIHGQLQAP